MKKLTLNKASFEGAEVLTRDQLKKIMGGEEPGTDGEGGSGGGGCGSYPECSTGSCTAAAGPCKGLSGKCGKTIPTKQCTCAVTC